MYGIISYEIETYLSNLRRNTGSEVRYSVVEAMEKHAIALGLPIVGPEVGRLLFILARVSGAQAVLELGSGFGYSAYWFSLGLGE